jgi:ParB family chromosome partitioning protein
MAEDTAVMKLAIDQVFPDPSQPRQSFDRSALERMAASIQARGILQPLRVRWDEQRTSWLIISGECRWRAAKLVGLSEIPCVPVLGELSETDVLADQIIENAVRNDLKPLELARALARLKALKGCSAQALAKDLGISGGAITKAEALLSLPEDIQAMVDDGRVPESTAYEISRMPDEQAQRELALAVAAGKVSRDGVAAAVHQLVGKKQVRPKAGRLSCTLEGGVSVTVRSGDPLTWDGLLAALDQLRRQIKKLSAEGEDVAALSRVLRAS